MGRYVLFWLVTRMCVCSSVCLCARGTMLTDIVPDRYGQSHRCNGPNFRSQKWTRDND